MPIQIVTQTVTRTIVQHQVDGSTRNITSHTPARIIVQNTVTGTPGSAANEFTAVNSLTTPALTKGMLIRVQGVATGVGGTIKRGRALGANDVVERNVGLLVDDTVAFGDNGTVRTSGLFTATTAQWDAVTGQTGGLTPGQRYFATVDFGTLRTTPPTQGEIDALPGQMVWLCPLGVALNATDFLINVEQPIQI